MTYKLLALDVDGTLFTSGGFISKHTKRKIAEAKQKGVMVTLATGRHYPFAKAIARELHLDAPMITHDGAYIAHPHNDEIYDVKRIPHQVVQAIIRLLVPLHVRVMILHESESITNHKFGWKDLIHRIGQLASLKYYLLENYSYQYMASEQMIAYVARKSLSPPKMFVTGEEKKMELAKERLNKRFAQEINITTSGYGLEILPLGTSKGKALSLLGEKLGIDRGEMMAIGDHYNDLEMIEYAGLGVAMGNAPVEIRMRADFITRTNDEEGVAYAIEKFLLND